VLLCRQLNSRVSRNRELPSLPTEASTHLGSCLHVLPIVVPDHGQAGKDGMQAFYSIPFCPLIPAIGLKLTGKVP